ncbi:hypothetical protein HYT84_00290 [Candidatus Micrarchaeota archaeon]|nr:hypothetical protein [Candidatus Micrarchaeota archaeon]
MKNVLFALFAFSLLSGLAIAHEVDNESNSADKVALLTKKHDQIACRIDFYKDILNMAEKSTNQSNADLTSKLDSQLSTLKEEAQGGDREGFNTAMKEIISTSKDVVLSYNEIKTSIQGKSDVRKSLREHFLSAKQSMNNCLRLTHVDLAKTRVKNIRNWVDDAKKVRDRLRDRGIETSDMDDITSEAEERASELEESAKTEDADKVREKERETRQKHLHIWARFHLAKFQHLLDRLDDVAIEKGFQSDVDSVSSLIQKTESMVQEGVPYSAGEFETVHDNIKEISKQLRDLNKKIKDQPKEETGGE